MASVVKVTREYPDRWDGTRSIEQAAKRWRDDVDLSRRFERTPGHAIVRYEDLVGSPVEALGPAWELLELDPPTADHPLPAGVIRESDPWLHGVLRPITASSRLMEFTPNERELILTLVDHNNF